ncbi:3-deoxy-D-manno-octulosonic acid transferase [Aliidongia dinghuensis]|uniref:3-deoxy-D-manno-octulosonic acid transferase n=1 Tax=Aliidongia dinghuensis TaxID=1867774 RepID=A0A8J3E4P7_9PROT|nr:3-deoxy-D-manno-octulosonic acid transferase [Aliidongia dinghuensis]GGF16117.1 3-deoxy-D-manno-octulosonic acid transferase [Aliidongia dinghuensis]
MSWLAAYRTATWAALPAVKLLLARRTRRGKEDPARRRERLGFAARPRSAGPLIWAHAASVGESLSLLPLIDRLLARLPTAEILVTSGTVTSAGLLAQRLPPRAFHQYVPIDHPGAVERFLDHWRPNLAIWVESELWPNLIAATSRRRVPMVLLNAKMSERAMRGWRRFPGLIRTLLGAFDLVLAQDETQAARLNRLGARSAVTVGDLKSSAAPLPADAAELAALTQAIGDRPVWLAAQTHDGEEAIVADAHRRIAAGRPGLLTLLAPRHPNRAPAIAALLAERGLTVARRSAAAPIEPATDLYLADTLGEMGLFYRLGGIVLVAGSLLAPGTIGGHNPIEPALLGAAILHGPDMVNCAANAAALDAAGGAWPVVGAAGIAEAVGALLDDPARRTAMGRAAEAAAAAEAGVVDRALERLEPLIAPLAAGTSHARA